VTLTEEITLAIKHGNEQFPMGDFPVGGLASIASPVQASRY